MRTFFKRIIFVTVVILLFASCRNSLRYAYKLSPGMTKQEVLNLLGPPAINDFDRNVEEWHYCNYMGNYIALYFTDGKLIARTSYSVSEYDRMGELGDCAYFARRGNYRVPDKVIEIRNIYSVDRDDDW